LRLSDLSRSISEVLRNVVGSVVTVSTMKLALNAYFELRPIKGLGSGFVVGPGGLIVTNFHVVGGASEILVTLPSGDSRRADVIALDPTRDLALLRIDGSGLRPLKLGDSDSIELGELVFAVGSPLGLPGPTVTMGIVSAVGRTLVSGKVVLEDLIQTDAAINPGNSGGPVVNAEGEVIGVATAIVPYAQGIGFAIPINTVKRFIEMTEKYGKPLNAWIGVYVAPVTAELAKAYGLPVSKGLVIVRVVPMTPAHELGLSAGDVIVRANDMEVSKPRDLRRIIENSVEEGYVYLDVVRGSKLYHGIKVPVVVQSPY